MADLSRRVFLRGAAGAAGGALLAGPFGGLLAAAARAEGRGPAPYPLRPVRDLRDGTVRLWLPKGFEYRSFHDTDGAPIVLGDDTVLPGRHDGMAAFAGPDSDSVWLVRNHEVNGNVVDGAFGPGTPYDSSALGGTTTVLVDRFGNVEDAFTSLNGTQMNCMGGPMPWESWITCEETVNGPDVGPDFTGRSNEDLTQKHGYIFEVPADGQSSRMPIRNAGRFAHEAAVWSEADGHLYLTEDNFGFPSGFYRYAPPTQPTPSEGLADGGTLQMLAVEVPQADLAASQPEGATYDVTWVDIEEPDPTFASGTTNNEAIRAVGDQGRAKGAAWFSRLEGAVYEDGIVYFCSTQGGGAPEAGAGPIRNGFGNGFGQVWAYDVMAEELRLVFESPGPEALDLPDNVTVGPNGALVLCEDGPVDNYLRGLTPDGHVFDIALNRLRRNDPPHAKRYGEEFAGATFSPDGHTLFVNIQASSGVTFAIWGPWAAIGV
ncbi:MAG: PhoX family protein [Actinobacteria bacterium]|nr:PhoX family protein [Actinomycetota bacterium]